MKARGSDRKVFTVPCGKDRLSFRLPEGFSATVTEPSSIRPLRNIEEAVRKNIEDPVGSSPLKDIVKPSDRVAIVTTDSTRACPDDVIVAALIEELKAAGVADDNITILVALGLHRKMTPEEKEKKFGRAVFGRYKIIDHDAFGPDGIINLGEYESIPLTVNRIAHEADILISTGIVEPHQYAGYSGGFKTVAIGVAGEKTINSTHGLKIIDNASTRLGNLEGNPFFEAVVRAGRLAGVKFIVNVVTNKDGEVAAVRAGEPMAVFLELVSIAKKMYEISVEGVFDVIVCGVEHPKGVNLYQASRAASYMFFSPRRIIRDKGVIIIAAPCEEGAGRGEGEKRFYELMRSEKNAGALLDRIRRDGIRAGEQRAFVMAKVLSSCDVMVVGSLCPQAVRAMHMTPAQDMDEALSIVKKRFGNAVRALICPHPFHTVFV